VNRALDLFFRLEKIADDQDGRSATQDGRPEQLLPRWIAPVARIAHTLLSTARLLKAAAL
jgi:hypothetical protein